MNFLIYVELNELFNHANCENKNMEHQNEK